VVCVSGLAGLTQEGNGEPSRRDRSLRSGSCIHVGYDYLMRVSTTWFRPFRPNNRRGGGIAENPRCREARSRMERGDRNLEGLAMNVGRSRRDCRRGA
jgi:hypothetical protein